VAGPANETWPAKSSGRSQVEHVVSYGCGGWVRCGNSCHWAAVGLNDAIVNVGVEGWPLLRKQLVTFAMPIHWNAWKVIKQRHGRHVELAAKLGIFDVGIDCHHE
jgi:hypothetical protein